MYTLKLIDEKILSELFLNSKQSYRQLAKKLNISKENLSKKVENYKTLNILRDFAVGVNYDKLGFMEYNLFIRLKKLDSSFYDKFLIYLNNHNNTTWIGKSFGKYDIKISLIVRNYSDVNNFIFDLSKKFPDKIDIVDSLFVIDKYKSSKELFISNLFPNVSLLNSINKNEVKNIQNIKDIKLEEIDKIIIYEVSQNPKITLVELGHKLSILPETLKYKISKLEKNKYLNNYSIVFNGKELNKIWCVVLLNISQININNFKDELKKNKHISSFVETQGVWNLSATFFASDINSLYENLNELRSNFSKDILNFEYMIYFDFYKFPKAPLCILEI
jgi:Lrp/AsnC family leucine-responsive transcriptional regulator